MKRLMLPLADCVSVSVSAVSCTFAQVQRLSNWMSSINLINIILFVLFLLLFHFYLSALHALLAHRFAFQDEWRNGDASNQMRLFTEY